jgi:deazaflavin-dependent oxidoreductase (nitroreductase family)
MLTVPGRKSGEYHSNPVSIVQDGENKYLVSPYGEVNWVKNSRAAGEVTLGRGGRSTRYAIEEVSPEVSGQVLKMYMTQETITQPYFDAKPISPVEEFIAEAHRHPVFRLTEK